MTVWLQRVKGQLYLSLIKHCPTKAYRLVDVYFDTFLTLAWGFRLWVCLSCRYVGNQHFEGMCYYHLLDSCQIIWHPHFKRQYPLLRDAKTLTRISTNWPISFPYFCFFSSNEQICFILPCVNSFINNLNNLTLPLHTAALSCPLPSKVWIEFPEFELHPKKWCWPLGMLE